MFILLDTEGVLGDISPAPSPISPLDPRDKDAFVIKFNSSGEEIFKVQIGSLNEDRGLGIDTDADDNFYIGGFIKGDIDTNDSEALLILMKMCFLQGIMQMVNYNG